MIISDRTKEFVDEIDDAVVRTELQNAIDVAGEVPVGRAVDQAVSRYMELNRNQVRSIDRLLGLNMDAGIRERNLEREVDRLKRQLAGRPTVGPE